MILKRNYGSEEESNIKALIRQLPPPSNARLLLRKSTKVAIEAYIRTIFRPARRATSNVISEIQTKIDTISRISYRTQPSGLPTTKDPLEKQERLWLSSEVRLEAAQKVQIELGRSQSNTRIRCQIIDMYLHPRI
jgi:hypothetical protein